MLLFRPDCSVIVLMIPLDLLRHCMPGILALTCPEILSRQEVILEGYPLITDCLLTQAAAERAQGLYRLALTGNCYWFPDNYAKTAPFLSQVLARDRTKTHPERDLFVRQRLGEERRLSVAARQYHAARLIDRATRMLSRSLLSKSYRGGGY